MCFLPLLCLTSFEIDLRYIVGLVVYFYHHSVGRVFEFEGARGSINSRLSFVCDPDDSKYTAHLRCMTQIKSRLLFLFLSRLL